MTRRRSVPCLLWPFWAIWRLIITIVSMTGRLIAVLLGIVLVVVGIILSLTIVGAIIGIPMVLVGLMMIVRGIF